MSAVRPGRARWWSRPMSAMSRRWSGSSLKLWRSSAVSTRGSTAPRSGATGASRTPRRLSSGGSWRQRCWGRYTLRDPSFLGSAPRVRRSGQRRLPLRSAVLAVRGALRDIQVGAGGLSEVLRQGLRDAPGIAVCTILPGVVDTPIYRHAANYVGREIRPLPPGHVAGASCGRDSAGRGPTQGPNRGRPDPAARSVGARPDATPLRSTGRSRGHIGALRNIPTDTHDGNIFEPHPDTNSVDDGWREHDHRRIGQAAAIAAAATVIRRTSRARAQRMPMPSGRDAAGRS